MESNFYELKKQILNFLEKKLIYDLFLTFDKNFLEVKILQNYESFEIRNTNRDEYNNLIFTRIKYYFDNGNEITHIGNFDKFCKKVLKYLSKKLYDCYTLIQYKKNQRLNFSIFIDEKIINIDFYKWEDEQTIKKNYNKLKRLINKITTADKKN